MIPTDFKPVGIISIELEKYYSDIIENINNDKSSGDRLSPVEKSSSSRISAPLKRAVWDKYIGREIGVGKCFCCKTEEIRQLHFECGHVESVNAGGATSVENLRPICSLCNKSMGTKNMMVYMKENNFLK